MMFGFVWPEGRHKLTIRCLFVSWNEMVWYKCNGVSSGWHTRTDTLCKPSKFVGESSFPGGAIRAQNEVAIILCVSCGGVEDGVASVKLTRLGPCVEVGLKILASWRMADSYCVPKW